MSKSSDPQSWAVQVTDSQLALGGAALAVVVLIVGAFRPGGGLALLALGLLAGVIVDFLRQQGADTANGSSASSTGQGHGGTGGGSGTGGGTNGGGA